MRWNFTLPFAMASLLCLLANPVCAQINVFTTNDGGFENSTSSFSANGWTEVNDNNSKWYVGTAAVGGGSKGAYIDKNASAGSVNTYNNNNALTSHFYRDFSIPTGATNITLTFKWRCGGESADNLRVYVVPTTTTPAAGTALSTGLVGGSYFGQGTSFQSPSITLTGIAGTTRRLVFSWTQNANNSGANPPAAVDDVQIQYTLPGCTGTPNQGSITAGATSFCGSGATTLTLTGATTGSGISYQWQYYNGTTWVATGTNATTHNTGTLSATTQFRVVTTCSNSGLAANSPTATITVNPSPDVSVSPADTFICTSGGSMTLTATGTATSYTWSPGTDLNTTTGSTVIATPANGRSYTVTGTLGPCSTSAIAIVSVGSGPAITSSANPAVLCSGESTQLTSSQASGEYEVYPIAPYVLTPASPTVALQYPGFAPTNNNYDDGRTAPISLPFNFTFYGNSYSQMFFATNGVIGFTQNNLVDYVPQNLPDGGNPNNLIALFWHDMDMSSTGTVSYGTVGTAPNRRFVVTYSGVPTLGNSSPDNSGQVILHETTNYIDVVVEKSTTGDYKTLGIENQGGSAGLTPSNRNDDYWTVTSTPEAYRFAIPSYTHSWSPGTFLGATNIYNPAASNVTATTAYTVNIKNSVTGCASNSTVTVTANPLPTASVTAGTSPVCDGQSSSVTFTGTPNATVTYDVNGGTAQTVTLDGSGSATVSTGSISSTAVYQLQSVTSAQNCTEMITGSATIVVNVRPTASIAGSQAICDGATAFPTISIGQGTPPWTVTYTDGTTTFTETSSFTSFALTLAPSVTTTYTLVDITDANCASVAGDVSGSAVITVHPRPTATLATTVPYVCEGSSAGLVVTLTGTPPYQFDVFDGSSYTSYTNITTATYTIPVNPLSATTYSISYLQDANCIGSGADLGNTVTLGYYTRPTATIQGSGTICSGNSTNITVTLTGSGPWSITYHDGSSNVPVTGIGTSPHVFSVSPSVSSTYTLVSVSDANCQAISGDMSGSAVVAVNNGPAILSQSGDVSGCSGSNAVLAVNATGTGLTYQWMENGAPLSDGGVYTGATTATLQISDITSLGGNTYQLQITGTCPPVISSTPVVITENTVNNWIGVVDTKWSTPGNWSCGILPTAATNVNITPSAPFQPEVDIPTAICRRLLIYPGSSVEIIGSGNALEVKTDVINLGQFDADAGKLILSGNGPQNAPGVVYKELEVLGGSVKTFLGNVMVTGNLNLYAGYIQLGQYNLTIAENANVNGGGPSSFIVTDALGTVIGENMGVGANTGTVVFPVGSNTLSYTPVMISNSGMADDIKVRVIDGVWEDYNGETGLGAPQTNNAVNKTWFITETIPGGSNATITPQWSLGDELPGFNHNMCAVSHYIGMDEEWVPGPLGNANGFNPYDQTLTGVTSFSPFGVSSSGSPLGLELLSFTGQLLREDAHLKWVTTNEKDMSKYEVERSLDNGRSYGKIGSKAATGNSNIGTNNYFYTDVNVTSLDADRILYRLKMVEQGGKYSYSDVVSLRLSKEVSSVVELFPNPVTGSELFIRMGERRSEELTVNITDMSGKVIATQHYAAGSYNPAAMKVDVSQLAQGIYMVRIVDAGNTTLEVLKFSRQ